MFDADAISKEVRDNGGRVRIAWFEYTHKSPAGTAGDTINLVRLKGGRIRIICIHAKVNAWGSSRTMNIGLSEYFKASDSSVEAKNATAVVTSWDISTAKDKDHFPDDTVSDIWSVGDVTLFATVTGGSLDVGKKVEGYVTYTYD